MNGGRRSRIAAAAVLMATVVAVFSIFRTTRPRTIGTLSDSDRETIYGLVGKKSSVRLVDAIRGGQAAALGEWIHDWILDWRNGRVLQIEVVTTNRFHVLIATSVPHQAKMVVVERRCGVLRVPDSP